MTFLIVIFEQKKNHNLTFPKICLISDFTTHDLNLSSWIPPELSGVMGVQRFNPI